MGSILLVEDNPGDAQLIRLAFEEAGIDCELSLAPTGEVALEMLNSADASSKQTLPDIIMLDLNLPGMDGKEVLGVIKSHERLKRIPVLTISSSAAEDDIGDAYDLYGNSYIQKPSDIAGFVSVVRSIGEFWLNTARLPTLASS